MYRVIWGYARRFWAIETRSSVVLFVATLAALVCANTPYTQALYHALWEGDLYGHTCRAIVNDAWMVLFFVLVGLEIKQECVSGHLATWSARLLPGMATLGGVVCPAVIYAACNHADPVLLRGWAIPTATDIAFALGVLHLCGAGVPRALRMFLMTIAVLDDLCAIVLVGTVYTQTWNGIWLGVAGIWCGALAWLGWARVSLWWAYSLAGLGLWYSVAHAGIHPTIAGVLLAFSIPTTIRTAGGALKDWSAQWIARLHPWVAYGILPVFAFANSGVMLQHLETGMWTHSVPVGIALGLALGKPLGIFGMTAAMVRVGWAQIPPGVSYRALLGVSLLCGIGFTMSLFISDLAFPKPIALHPDGIRAAILFGSAVSAMLGFWVLRGKPGVSA